MKRQNNRALGDRLTDLTEVDSAIDLGQVPFSDILVPTLTINDDVAQAATIAASAEATDASATIYTTVNNPRKQFYLTGVTLAVRKTATSTSTSYYVTILRNGTTVRVVSIYLPPSVANSGVVTREFTKPIPCDVNTAITMVLPDSQATIEGGASISGFYQAVRQNNQNAL